MFLDCRLGPTLSCLVAEKKGNLQINYSSATTTNPSITLCNLYLTPHNVLHLPFYQIFLPPPSSSILLHSPPPLHHLLDIIFLHLDLIRRLCYSGRKVADLNIYVLLPPNKTEWALVYSPETAGLHLKLAVHNVQWNCICRLGRYLMT